MTQDPAQDQYTDKELMEFCSRREQAFEHDAQWWTPMWRQLRDQFMPMAGRGLSVGRNTVGQDTTQKGTPMKGMLDNTARDSLRVLGAGMQGGLTSPARPWFRLTLEDKEMAEWGPVRNWLDDLVERMRGVYAGNNTYQALHSCYQECATFGTWSCATFEHADKKIWRRPYTIGSYYLSLNEDLEVDTWFHTREMSVRQMVGEFGLEHVSSEVRNLYDKGEYENRRIVKQLIEPNDDRFPVKDMVGRPFRSLYWEPGERGAFLGVSGYYEFPLVTPRWDVVAGDTYGASPALDALSPAQGLQMMRRRMYLLLDKEVEPPLVGPPGAKLGALNTAPGGMNTDPVGGGQGQGLRALYQVQPNYQYLEHVMEQTRDQIRRGLFTEMFLMLANSRNTQMTATEVAERHEEKMLMLGPVLERLHTELLEPMISRDFAILQRNRQIPPPPKEIEGAPLKIEYVSILAQAQKMVGLQTFERATGYAKALADVDPSVLDAVDTDKLVDEYFERSGMPSATLRTALQRQQIRKARAEQQAAAQRVEQNRLASETARNLGQAELGDENTALKELMGGPA